MFVYQQSFRKFQIEKGGRYYGVCNINRSHNIVNCGRKQKCFSFEKVFHKYMTTISMFFAHSAGTAENQFCSTCYCKKRF